MDEAAALRKIELEEPLLIRAVDVWNPEGVLENRDVLVEGGRVSEIRRGTGGLLLCPGVEKAWTLCPDSGQTGFSKIQGVCRLDHSRGYNRPWDESPELSPHH